MITVIDEFAVHLSYKDTFHITLLPLRIMNNFMFIDKVHIIKRCHIMVQVVFLPTKSLNLTDLTQNANKLFAEEV